MSGQAHKISYIGLPTDIALKKISPAHLDTLLVTTLPKNDPASQTKDVNEVINATDAATSPIIIVDGGKSSRFIDYQNQHWP
jgi:TPP-dependent 2-oxoacid decarboxylase